MKILLAISLVFLMNTLSWATLTPGKVPVTKTGGASPVLQNGSITDTGTASGSGNVGIGSANPGQALDVQGTVRAFTYIGTGSGTSTFSGNVSIGTLNNVNALDIATGGVSIGTAYAAVNTAPTNGLIVQGNVGIGTFYTNVGIGTTGSAHIGSVIQITSNGQYNPIGIPLENLDVQDNVNDQILLSPWDGSIQFLTNNVPQSMSLNPYGGNISLGIAGNAVNVGINSLFPGARLDVQGTVRILNSGNLGISVAPTNKLDVNGGEAVGSYAGVNTAPSNGLIVSGNIGIGTTKPINAFQVNAGVNIPVVIDSAGNFGIGVTSTNAPLDLERSSGLELLIRDNTNSNERYGWVTGSNGGKHWGGMQSVDNGQMRFGVNNNLGNNLPAIVIESSLYGTGGNVGIGSVSPGAKLDVQGTVRIFQGGSSSKGTCWCTDGVTLGYDTGIVAVTGAATCNTPAGAC